MSVGATWLLAMLFLTVFLRDAVNATDCVIRAITRKVRANARARSVRVLR